jgi:DNA helicase-2/ATP-dependent DNA helicase PcrA
VDGVFPSSRSFIDADGDDIEEEKRLFYVAVTRAKEELFLSFFIKKGTNERSAGKLCRFLDPANVRTTFEKRTVGPLSRPAPRRSRY